MTCTHFAQTQPAEYCVDRDIVRNVSRHDVGNSDITTAIKVPQNAFKVGISVSYQ